MRMRNIADRISDLGGSYSITASTRDDGRYIVKLVGKLGDCDLEAIDYASLPPSPKEADASAIAVKPVGAASDPSADYSPWTYFRTIRSLNGLKPREVRA